MPELSATDSVERLRWVASYLSVTARQVDGGDTTANSCPQRVGSETELLGSSLKDPIEVLARTVWGEARGEGKRGMEAVANVVCNRANNPRWWGRNIIQVCLKPWQFSAWNPDDANRRRLLAVTADDRQFRLAMEIAAVAVAGNLDDVTNYADHFHVHAVRPLWSQGARPVAIIGGHRFFRLELRRPA